MPKVFTLYVTLENDAMQDGRALADALRKVADDVQAYREFYTDSSIMNDTNGNKVGAWMIECRAFE